MSQATGHVVAEPVSAQLDAAPASAPLSLFDRIFLGFVVLYWALQFLRGDMTEIVPMDLLYYFYVLPAAGFAMIGLGFLLVVTRQFNRSAIMMLMMIVLVFAVSISRGDVRTIASVGLLAATVLIMVQLRPSISLAVINGLFVSAVIITTLLYFMGYSAYTFVPGLNSHPTDWWRISAYPSVSEGGLFAMVVFVVNLASRGQSYRLPMLLGSAYMLLLSGSRTGLFAALICVPYILLRRGGMLTRETSKMMFVGAAVGVFLFVVFASEFLLNLPFSNSEFFRTVILRQDEYARFNVGSELGTAAVRQWIFDQHMAVFWSSPFTGIGTFDLAQLTTGYEVFDNSGTGSEAFVTGLLARIGLISLLLYVAVFFPGRDLRGENGDRSIVTRIGLIVGMVTYGSFVNVYDVLFLLLLAGSYGGIVNRRPELNLFVPPSGRLVHGTIYS